MRYVAAVVAALLLVATGFWLGTRGGSGRIDDLQAQVARGAVERERVTAAYADSLAGARAAADAIRAKTDTLVIERPVLAVRRAEVGADLQEYLADDPTGLELLVAYDAAWTEQLTLETRIAENAIVEADTLRRALVYADQAIAFRDSTYAELLTRFDAAAAEGHRLERRLNPPWAIRLISDGADCAGAALAAGAASSDLLVGGAAAVGCAAVKWLRRRVHFP